MLPGISCFSLQSTHLVQTCIQSRSSIVSMPLVDQAAMWAHGAIMNNHGQNCCAGSRTYVQESIYDEFVAKCKFMAEMRQVGDPWDAMTQQGPQVKQTVIPHAKFFWGYMYIGISCLSVYISHKRNCKLFLYR